MKISDTSSSLQQSPSRKLALKKETLRQLTGSELRHVAGGSASSSSVISRSAPVSASSGASVISVSISGSISGRPGY